MPVAGAASGRCAEAIVSTAHATFSLAHFGAKNVGKSGHTSSDLFFIEAGESQTERIGLRALHVKIAARSKENAALFRVNEEFACVKTERQFEPCTHATFRQGPARAFGHVAGWDVAQVRSDPPAPHSRWKRLNRVSTEL